MPSEKSCFQLIRFDRPVEIKCAICGTSICSGYYMVIAVNPDLEIKGYGAHATPCCGKVIYHPALYMHLVDAQDFLELLERYKGERFSGVRCAVELGAVLYRFGSSLEQLQSLVNLETEEIPDLTLPIK